MAGEPKDKAELTSKDDPYRDLTGALHDVSNALTVLLGWVGEARHSSAASPELEPVLAMVEERARVARDLARRAVGAPRAGGAARDEEADAVVASVLRALAVEAQRAEVRLVGPAAAPPDGREARVEAPDDLAQILTNLVMNAIAYAPPGSAITVVREPRESHLRIVVQDEGPGVEPARADSIFAGDSSRSGGAGVGLRHARAVSRARGGELEIELPGAPGHPGRGARFAVSWPRAEGPKKPPVSATKMPVLAGTRILVVEDDPDVAALLEGALGARGADVTIARSAKDLELASTRTVDAALVDLSPIANDVDGAMAHLRAASPNARVVFISGSAAGLPEALALGSPGVRWVRKPFEVAEIVAALLDGEPAAKDPRADAPKRL